MATFSDNDDENPGEGGPLGPPNDDSKDGQTAKSDGKGDKPDDSAASKSPDIDSLKFAIAKPQPEDSTDTDSAAEKSADGKTVKIDTSSDPLQGPKTELITTPLPAAPSPSSSAASSETSSSGVAAETAKSKTTDTKTSDSKTTDSKTTDSKTTDSAATVPLATDPTSSEGEVSEAKVSDAGTADFKSGSNITEILGDGVANPRPSAPTATSSETPDDQAKTVDIGKVTSDQMTEVFSIDHKKPAFDDATELTSAEVDVRSVAKTVRASMADTPDATATDAKSVGGPVEGPAASTPATEKSAATERDIVTPPTPGPETSGPTGVDSKATPKAPDDNSEPAFGSKSDAGQATSVFSGKTKPAINVPKPSSPAEVKAPATAAIPAVPPPTASSKPDTKPPIAKIKQSGLGAKKYALLAIPVLLVVAFFGAWAIDESSRGDAVARNTNINGEDISGLAGEELTAAITSATAEVLDVPLTVSANGGQLVTTARELGATTDIDTTSQIALDSRRNGFVLGRPFTWASTFLKSNDIEASYEVDPQLAAEAAQTTFEPIIDPVIETSLEVSGTRFSVVEGQPGQTIDPEEIEAELPEALSGAERPVLELTPIEGTPQISTADAEAAAEQAAQAVAEPVEVQLLDESATLETSSLREMVTLAVLDGEATWSIDNELAVAELKREFPSIGADGDSARFAIVDGQPIVVPVASAIECCDETTGERLREGLADRSEDDDAVALEPNFIAEDPTAAELEALGIVEEVSSFTTPHAAGGARVTNIQRFADLMRGTVIDVGEELSLNEAVGQRTIAKGFAADGAINQGVIEDQVGGGISQFATTFFNAAFFSGIEINSYQFHTLAISSRYPLGRESTISWPAPNVTVTNTSEHPILVWTSYTNTSITVKFYSKKHLTVTDVNGNELAFDVYQPGGRDTTFPPERTADDQCTIYTTRRNTTFPDGEVVRDSFTGFYRPGEGKNCDGTLTPKAQEEQDKKDAAEAAAQEAANEVEPAPVVEPVVEPEPEAG